jgi:hypothetical protein
MAVEIQEKADGMVLVVRANGKLSREDYEHFVPEVERQVEQHGKIRMLFDMHDFHGWTAGALWQDMKFGLKHFQDIERLALVGEKPWQQGMAVFCRPFTRAQIRYFDRTQAEQASVWVQADMPVARGPGSDAT